ncbi:hypothetical protein D3C72_1527500 [compost metagenome]
MSGNQCNALRHAALRQGNAAGRGGGKSGGDAIDDFAGHAVVAEPLGLFAAAAEDAGIAALQARHAQALPGIAQHQALDEFLRRRSTAAALAHVHQARLRTVVQDLRIDQVIDQDDIGAAQRLHRFERQ